MGRTIAVANQKGGCGKTTTAVNLCACLARQDRRVLLVDLDPQGHAALGLGVDPERLERSVYEVLTLREQDRLPVGEALIEIDSNLHLLPSNVLLSALEQELSGRPGREERLSEALAEVASDYDYLLLDCPPSLGLLTFNALRFAHEVLVPGEASYFAQHGVRRLLEVIALLRERFEQQLVLYGLITNFDGRSAFARMMAEEQRVNFPGIFLQTVIHVSSKIREAAYCGQPVIQYARYSRSAKEFRALAEEVLGQEAQAALLDLHAAVPQRAMAPPAAEEEVLFRLRAPKARSVSIVGTFNDWRAKDLLLRGPDEDGYWYASLVLPRGSHQYKFVVDDAWMVDPENPLKQKDGFGGINSVVEL